MQGKRYPNEISLNTVFNVKISKLNKFIKHKSDSDFGVDYIVLFNRTPNTALLSLDNDSMVVCSKYCSYYMIVNENKSVYGVAFLIRSDSYKHSDSKITISGGISNNNLDFKPLMKTSENTNINVFKNSSEELLIISSVIENDLVVTLDQSA